VVCSIFDSRICNSFKMFLGLRRGAGVLTQPRPLEDMTQHVQYSIAPITDTRRCTFLARTPPACLARLVVNGPRMGRTDYRAQLPGRLSALSTLLSDTHMTLTPSSRCRSWRRQPAESYSFWHGSRSLWLPCWRCCTASLVGQMTGSRTTAWLA
jgi:hypothetical protein